ncbi:MAG: methyltransferase domain-containing protein [Candidatus Erginobacter occultus]|nr:methyltransferase domain-containing protein [Candidatus Erginobacter occultus]
MTERSGSIWIVRRILDRQLGRLIPRLEGVVLDIGSGPQPYRELLYRSGVKRYVALDWPNSPHGPGMEISADMTRLPFSGEVFDGILCTQVLEHCPDPSAALAEGARVLKPGGKVLLSVPFLFQEHELPWDYYRYTDRGIRYLLGKAGLSIREIKRLGGPGVVISVLTSRIAGITLGWCSDAASALARKLAGVGKTRCSSYPAVWAGYLSWLLCSIIQLPVYLSHLVLEKVPSVSRRIFFLRPLHSILEKLGTEMNSGYVILAEKPPNSTVHPRQAKL